MGLEEEEEEEKKEWREEVRKLALDTSNRTKLPTAECVNINVVLDKAASHARAHTHRVNLHSDADESSFYALTENGRANQQKWGDDERWVFFFFPWCTSVNSGKILLVTVTTYLSVTCYQCVGAHAKLRFLWKPAVFLIRQVFKEHRSLSWTSPNSVTLF